MITNIKLNNGKINADALFTDFIKSFNQENVILFLGQEADKELTDAVYNLPWSCVVTTNNGREYDDRFINQSRSVRDISDIDEKGFRLFDRRSLPVIHIYGSEDIDTLKGIELAKAHRHADKIMTYVMHHLDTRTRMVIVGYDPDNLREYPSEQLELLFEETSGGNVTIFNTLPEEGKVRQLHEYAEGFAYEWYDLSLAELLENKDVLNTDIDEENLKKGVVYYKNGDAVTIDRNILLRNEDSAVLLNEELINAVRPYGRKEQARWYYNFLVDSARSPQWYGYRKQSEFYLKRNYEDCLICAVKNLLDRGSLTDADRDRSFPLILEGDPGSSKSIELGKLAYSVYEDRKYPVIYIRGNANLSNSGGAYESLNELLEESVGNENSRTLIIWDSSSFRDIESIAVSLSNRLINRGRRFILVCSAYNGVDKIKGRGENRRYMAFNHDERKFISSTQMKAELIFDDSCYFVKATREISVSERSALRQQLANYQVADAEVLNLFWKKITPSDTIFDIYYKLIVYLRPNLESGLDNEQRKVNLYVEKQLERMSGIRAHDKFYNNDIRDALVELGLEADQSESVDDEKVDGYDLHKFDSCIALFSRYKLDTPYNLAMGMLNGGADFSSLYNSSGRAVFELVTYSIPYIVYTTDDNGSYIFRFRNTIEADFYLERNNIDGAEQVNMICSYLDYYAEDFRINGSVDQNIRYSLMKLIRLIGPNSTYFNLMGSRQSEHVNILLHMDQLLDKLAELRTDRDIPDENQDLAIIEITFRREYFASKGERVTFDTDSDLTSMEFYITGLYETINLAIECAHNLKESLSGNDNKKAVNDRINNLTVETCLCNQRIEEFKSRYEKYCKEHHIAVSESIRDIRTLSYTDQFSRLQQVINTYPLNGYAYNTLFKMFEKEYENTGSKDERLSLLSEVWLIANEAQSLDIVNRGSGQIDELSGHLLKITDLADDSPVYIDDVINETYSDEIGRWFHSSLTDRQAAAICFVCGNELQRVKLDSKSLRLTEKDRGSTAILSEIQKDVCKKIIDFMQRPEYMDIVEGDQNALYFYISVLWMYYNSRPLTGGREKQLTYICQEGWQKIKTASGRYVDTVGHSRPLVVLIYALSIIHTTSDYMKALVLLKELREDDFYLSQRMWVPYIICDESGHPVLFSGTVNDVSNYSGHIRVSDIPGSAGLVRFFIRNLHLHRMPDINTHMKNLELGVGYMGYSLYIGVEEEDEANG